jgi:SMI1 / KNR4 family (SUKH-1)
MSWKMVFPSLDKFPVVKHEDVAAFQQRQDLKLPADYVEFLLRYRGSPPMLQNEAGAYAQLKFSVDWKGKAAGAVGSEVTLTYTYGLFEGHEIDSPFKGGCDLDDNILWNEHLHPSGLMPIGSDAGNSLFLMGVSEKYFGRIFFLTIFHLTDPVSFDYIGDIAPSFSSFVQLARPDV